MLQRQLEERGIETELFVPEGSSGAGALRDRFHNPRIRRPLGELIESFRPDLLHVHNFLRRLSPVPFKVAKEHGLPSVLTVHDFQLVCPRTWAIRADGMPCPKPEWTRCVFGSCRGSLRGPGGRLIYAMNTLRRAYAARIVAREATSLMTPAQALADRIERALGRTAQHVPHPFENLGPFTAPTSRDLLFVGRVAQEKGIDLVLDGLSEVEGLSLTVAGDGPDLEPLRERTRKLALEERVTFLGRVEPGRVRELMKEHGALVVPSVWMETGPLVVFEAFSAGRPVLGSERGGIAEQVEDQKTGFVFEPTRQAAVVEALRAYRRLDDVAHAEMARRAYDRSLTGRLDQFVDRVLEVYEASRGGTNGRTP